MESYPFTEPFETIGEWFVPSDPDHKIVGRLSYKAGRTELHLNGTFQPLHGSIQVAQAQVEYPLVYGIIRSGRPMTLVKPQRLGMSLHMGMSIEGLQQSEGLLTTVLVVGAHISEDACYTELRCRIPGLNIWLSRQVVTHTVGLNEHTQEVRSVFQVENPPDETTHIPHIGANVGWSVSVQCDNVSNPFGVSVSSTGWLCVHPDIPQPIAWHFDQLYKITTLLAFFAGSPLPPDCINLVVAGSSADVAVLVSTRDTKYCTYGSLREFYMVRSVLGASFEEVRKIVVCGLR